MLPGEGRNAGRQLVPRNLCATCAKPFYAPPSQRKRGGGLYCSNKCYGAAKMVTEVRRACRVCKEPMLFQRGEPITKVCDPCRTRRSDTTKPISQCRRCGGGVFKYTLFCGPECRKADAASKKTGLTPNALCVRCAAPFYAAPGHVDKGWGKYCSMKCRPLSTHSRGKGGTRDDLGFYVRSSWEANYARYLKWLQANGSIAAWAYEPETFEFPVKRGSKFYTPDFKVTETSGRVVFHEIKGYMDAKSATKIARFGRHFPWFELVVIGHRDMADIYRKVGGLIPHWERNQSDKMPAPRRRKVAK